MRRAEPKHLGPRLRGGDGGKRGGDGRERGRDGGQRGRDGRERRGGGRECGGDGSSSFPRRRESSKLALASLLALASSLAFAQSCPKPVYLTIDTGHMGVANLVADVLNRQHVKATFFAANEKTKEGDGSLGDYWAPWWKARAAEGHEFGSHTWDHVVWRADLPDGRFRVRPTSGPNAFHDEVVTAAQYCEEIDHAARRLEQVTGKKPLPLFRAPSGKTSPKFLAATKACGWRHVPWAAAGFLGDELPSETYSNKQLLDKALHDIKPGDILLMHLGIWSRRDPWAPADLEPLVAGLKARGFCFATLRDHPDYREWVSRVK